RAASCAPTPRALRSDAARARARGRLQRARPSRPHGPPRRRCGRAFRVCSRVPFSNPTHPALFPNLEGCLGAGAETIATGAPLVRNPLESSEPMRKLPKEPPSADITPETLAQRRREFLKNTAFFAGTAAAMGAGLLKLVAGTRASSTPITADALPPLPS